MLEIFRRFDRNKDGFITREELQASLEEVKMRQLEIDMDEIMKKADRDGDGKLSYDDFIKGCRFKSK
jgi:calmodulin